MRDELGIEDAWPVVAEPFFQWVLEDDHPARTPAVRGRRRAARRRRRAVRAHEAAAAQRQPPGPVLLRVPVRLPLRPRGDARTRRSRPSSALHGRGGHADPAARARHRPRRLQGDAHRALPATPRCATPWRGSAPSRATASRSGCCRWCARTWLRAARSPCRPHRREWARYAEGTDETASRSRSSTGWPSADRDRADPARGPARVHREPRRCSATSSTSSASPAATSTRSTGWSTTAPTRRWSACPAPDRSCQQRRDARVVGRCGGGHGASVPAAVHRCSLCASAFRQRLSASRG